MPRSLSSLLLLGPSLAALSLGACAHASAVDDEGRLRCDWVEAGRQRYCVVDLSHDAPATCPTALPVNVVFGARGLCVADVDEVGWGYPPELCRRVDGGCGIHAHRWRPRREVVAAIRAEPRLAIAVDGPWTLRICHTQSEDISALYATQTSTQAWAARRDAGERFQAAGGYHAIEELVARAGGQVSAPQWHIEVELDPESYDLDALTRSLAVILLRHADPDASVCVQVAPPVVWVPL